MPVGVRSAPLAGRVQDLHLEVSEPYRNPGVPVILGSKNDVETAIEYYRKA
jgi:hypothetical protein